MWPEAKLTITPDALTSRLSHEICQPSISEKATVTSSFILEVEVRFTRTRAEVPDGTEPTCSSPTSVANCRCWLSITKACTLMGMGRPFSSTAPSTSNWTTNRVFNGASSGINTSMRNRSSPPAGTMTGTSCATARSPPSTVKKAMRPGTGGEDDIDACIDRRFSTAFPVFIRFASAKTVPPAMVAVD